MPSTIAWPTSREFRPTRMSFGAITGRTRWVSPYTGQAQSVSHVADRLRVSVDLPMVDALSAGRREAYFMNANAAGSWLSVGHFQRPFPAGTMRGSPTLTSSATAGATQIAITTTAGATLEAGDVLSVGGQLVQCAYAGAVANGSGAMTMPLVLPLRLGLTGGAAITWDRPTATFQIIGLDPIFDYPGGMMQQGLTVELSEVFP